MKTFEDVNSSVEAFLVKFYQSEDESLNGAVFEDFEEAFEYFQYVCDRGFMPQVEFFYKEELVRK